jgi:uncharacterized protein (DUF1684 family)
MLLKTMKRILVWLVLALGLMNGCQNHVEPRIDNEYAKQIEKWRIERLNRLKSPDSWLSLAGLFWLENGENTFGSDAGNDFVFKKKGLPPRIGIFFLKDKSVLFKSVKGVSVNHQDQIIEVISMQNDAQGKPTVLKCDSLSWYVIKRGDRLGVRLKDSRHPRIQQLKQLNTFPIDKNWRIKAVLERYDKPQIIQIPTVLGTVEEQSSPGVLVFEIAGTIYHLHPTGSDGDLSVIFGDLTNTHETYGGGRFLVIEKPDARGHTWIDFNKAYNPPCVFSPYATCPLPPEKNQLNVRIVAGEKMVMGFGH